LKSLPAVVTKFTQLDIKPQVEASNRGKIVAIDIDTGAWEMDTNEIIASNRLKTRYPNAQIWFVRIGSRYIRRFGLSRIHKSLSLLDV
jgi:hypothetical protein